MRVKADSITGIKITEGSNSQQKYSHADSIIGKIVEATGYGYVEGNYGKERCSIIFFTDGTCHGHVQP